MLPTGCLKKALFPGILTLFISLASIAQQPDTLIRKLDSLQKQTDTSGKQVINTDRSAFDKSTLITPGGYFILLWSDTKQAFTTPFHLQKRDWRNAAYFVAAELALSFADEPIQRGALNLSNKNSTVRGVSKYVTQFGGNYEIYALLGLGAEGFLFKNQKLKTTTLLATQAYIVGAAVEISVKFITGRQRPNYQVGAGEPEPSFHGPFYKGDDVNGTYIDGSFPSGHATVAFAAATVFAMEYKNKLWVPILSYTAATLIGLSRLTENKHWATDIVAGAALGILTGQQVVNNYHRYALIRKGQLKKPIGSTAFNIGYQQGRFMPGLVFRFY
ncbi:MAG: phosphatase family protein [Sediminibacterium sp.]|nr:phosphatase family protein [Sediminibacterium sp.]